MRRPETIEIMGQPFEVRWEDREGVRLHPDSDHWVLGTTVVTEQVFVVRTAQGEHQKRDTVLHEILHALLLLTSHTDRFKEYEPNKEHPEEPVVAALASSLLLVLRANPELVDWLVER